MAWEGFRASVKPGVLPHFDLVRCCLEYAYRAVPYGGFAPDFIQGAVLIIGEDALDQAAMAYHEYVFSGFVSAQPVDEPESPLLHILEGFAVFNFEFRRLVLEGVKEFGFLHANVVTQFAFPSSESDLAQQGAGPELLAVAAMEQVSGFHGARQIACEYRPAREILG